MRKFSALLLLGAIAAVVLSGCNAAESGVPTDSETAEASAEMAADVPENDIDYIAEGLNAAAAFKEKLVCLDNIEYVENSEKIEVVSPFSDVPQLSGQYTVNGIADYNELVDFMTEACTENYVGKIFDEKGFINRDGKIYYYPVDMLLDMYAYDESKIVSYETNGNSVTYFCEASGTYDGGEPLDIFEYTFSVSFDGGKPVISDCTYDGHCNYWLLCYTLPLDGNAENIGGTLTEADFTSDDIIFIGENKIENFGDYADKNYTVDVDTAFENVLKTGVIPDNSKLICSGAALFKNDTYYVIEKIFDNGDAAVTEEIFWVNAENGSVYVFLDPTLPVSDDLKEFKNKIDEDDGRSRLIKIFDGNAENSAAKADPNDFIPLTEPVGTSGLEVTVEELMPIIETASYNMYLIDGGDEIFNFDNGRYVSFNQKDFYAVLYSFYDVFSDESEIADKFLSSLICYKSGEELLIERRECPNFTKVEEDIFNIGNIYEKVTIDGGAGSNPTYLYNEFEIINRTETTLTLKNTAYYNEENNEPIQVFEYDMVLEDGTWKFLNFKRWY